MTDSSSSQAQNNDNSENEEAKIQNSKQSENTVIQIHEEQNTPQTVLSGVCTIEIEKIVKHNEQRPDDSYPDFEINTKTTQDVIIPIEEEIIAIPQTAVISEKKHIGNNEKRAKSFAKKGQRKQWGFWHRKEIPKSKPKGFEGYGYQPKTVFISMDSEPVGDPISGAYDSSRNFFVLLVFAICGAMLFVTTGFVIFAISSDDFKEFAQSTAGILTALGCAIVGVIISYIFSCSSCSRQIPFNFILVFLATLVYSFIAGFAACSYAPIIVAAAAATTCVIVILCTCLALTSFDFTKFLLLVMVGMMAMFVASITTVILSKVLGVKLTILQLVLTAVSSILTSVMLVIELQMILGGKSVELGEEEYAFGAYMIYTSIITLFLQMLRLLGAIMGDDD